MIQQPKEAIYSERLHFSNFCVLIFLREVENHGFTRAEMNRRKMLIRNGVLICYRTSNSGRLDGGELPFSCTLRIIYDTMRSKGSEPLLNRLHWLVISTLIFNSCGISFFVHT